VGGGVNHVVRGLYLPDGSEEVSASLDVVNVCDEFVAFVFGLGKGLASQLAKVHTGLGVVVRDQVEVEGVLPGALYSTDGPGGVSSLAIGDVLLVFPTG